MLVCSLAFGNDELLLDSANAYKLVLRANQSAPINKLVSSASAIIIFPKFYKVGFIIGGMGGKGVMMVKKDNEWQPIGVNIGGASFGLQAGFENSFLVFYILKQSIIKDIEDAKFTLGADVSVSLGDIGVNNMSVKDFSFSKDIYAYSNNSGFFAGANLGGSVISVDSKAKFNTDSYGFKTLAKEFQIAE